MEGSRRGGWTRRTFGRICDSYQFEEQVSPTFHSPSTGAKSTNAQISMPPARLPARIDRSGLGGGSVLSPAALGATGAVAAATEAMLTLRADPPVYTLSLTKFALCRNRRAVASSSRGVVGAQQQQGQWIGRWARVPVAAQTHARARETWLESGQVGGGRTNGLIATVSTRGRRGVQSGQGKKREERQ